VCGPYGLVLTHTIDALSLREIPWSCRTLWGFAYRCLARAMSPTGLHLSGKQRLKTFVLGAATPLIRLGMLPDPWSASLETVLRIERTFGVRSTFFFAPATGLGGRAPDGHPAPRHRAMWYQVKGYQRLLAELEAGGWEVGVHGIDAYWSPSLAEAELDAIRVCTSSREIGIRMHWLYHQGERTWRILAQAGYAYDASIGWNDRIGFPGGHYAPFEVAGCRPFAVLPLNIHDVALFGHGLSEEEVWHRVASLLDEARRHRACVSVLWHNNSFAPPREWGSVYERIIERALLDGAPVLRAIDALKLWQGGGN